MYTPISAVFLTDLGQSVAEGTWVDWAAAVDYNLSLSPITVLGLLSNGKQTRTANMPLHLLPYSWEWNGVRSALPPLCHVERDTHTFDKHKHCIGRIYTETETCAAHTSKGFLFIACIFPEGLIVRTNEEDGAYSWKALQGIFRSSARLSEWQMHDHILPSACVCICISLNVFFVFFCHTHSREIFQEPFPLVCNDWLCAFPLRLRATSFQLLNEMFQKK